jgi:hypothetical protein
MTTTFPVRRLSDFHANEANVARTGTGVVSRSVRSFIREMAWTPEDFYIDADGTNFSLSINRAIAAASAAGGGEVRLQGRDYLMTTPVEMVSNVHLIGRPHSTRLLLNNSTAGVRALGSRNSSQNNTLASDAARGSWTVTLSAGKGANFTAGQYVLVRSEALYRPFCDAKYGDMRRILSISGDTLEFYSPLTEDFLVADSAAVDPLTMVSRCTLSGINVTNAARTTYTQNLTAFLYTEEVTLDDVRVSGNNRGGVAFFGSVGATVHNLRAVDMFSDNALLYLGYGINFVGINEGHRITDLFGQQCRHVFTTDFGSTLPYGVPTGISVVNGVARDCWTQGFDTHEEARAITYTNCSVLGGVGAQANGNISKGFVVRGQGVKLVGCHVENVAGPAVWIEKDSLEAEIDGLTIRNTNLLADLPPNDVYDWREMGAVFVDGKDATVANVRGWYTGGPLISIGQNATNYEVRDCYAVDPLRLAATANYAMGSEATGTTAATWINNAARCSDTAMDYGLYSPNSGQQAQVIGLHRFTNAQIAEVEVNSNRPVVGRAGPGMVSFGKQIAGQITSGVISIAAVADPQGCVIAMIGEGGAADDLDSIALDGVPNGAVVVLRISSATITVVHNASVIILRGAANATMSSTSFTLTLMRLDTVWVEIARNF